MFYNGSWGTVCDDQFDHNAAAVVCSKLGYERYFKFCRKIKKIKIMIKKFPQLTKDFILSSTAQVRTRNTFGSGNGTIVLDNVVCNGHETGLDKCRHNPPGVSDCSHGEDVGVVCSAGKVQLTSSHPQVLLKLMENLYLHSASILFLCRVHAR